MPDPRTAAERINLVWPLTREVASLRQSYGVEPRRPRHIAGLIRKI